MEIRWVKKYVLTRTNRTKRKKRIEKKNIKNIKREPSVVS